VCLKSDAIVENQDEVLGDAAYERLLRCCI
jgi:hypothetical protein